MLQHSNKRSRDAESRERERATKRVVRKSIPNSVIYIGINHKEIKLKPNGHGHVYEGDFYGYNLIEDIGYGSIQLVPLKVDPKTGLLNNCFYNRWSDVFLSFTADKDKNYKDYTGFFQLYLLMPIQEIRVYIFRFIGALLFKESAWRYTNHITLYYADWLSILLDLKKKTMEEIYLRYFKV
jgi:hypothetical protein